MAKRVRLTKKQTEARDTWLDHYETEYSRCRDLGHTKRVEKKWGTASFYRRKITCSGCGMSYEQNVHNGIVVWTGNRQYPTGYIKPSEAGPGRISREVFREQSDEDIPFDKDEPPGLSDLLKMKNKR